MLTGRLNDKDVTYDVTVDDAGDDFDVDWELREQNWTFECLDDGGSTKKAGLAARFSLCERVRELVVELELGEAVVNRVARALDAVIIVIAGILEIECQRCTVLRG